MCFGRQMLQVEPARTKLVPMENMALQYKLPHAHDCDYDNTGLTNMLGLLQGGHDLLN